MSGGPKWCELFPISYRILLNLQENQLSTVTILLIIYIYIYIDIYSFVYCTNRLFQVSTTRSSDAISDLGDVQLYSWGSLRLVYSPSKRRIYKNKACVACHGVSDGSEWTSRLQCKDIDEAGPADFQVVDFISSIFFIKQLYIMHCQQLYK